jgi:hypothetical protein
VLKVPLNAQKNKAVYDTMQPQTAVGEDAVKKIITLTACLGMSVFIAACGHGWKHATVPASKWDEAYADCVHQAESGAQSTRQIKDPAQNWGAYGGVRYLIDKCMEEKGYYRAGDKP